MCLDTSYLVSTAFGPVHLKVWPWSPFGGSPHALGYPGKNMVHMNSYGSLSPKGDPYQVLLQSACNHCFIICN